jgi:sialate O-acetylesterase
MEGMKDTGLSPFISNSMIIQRNSIFPVWSKKKVSVVFLGKTYESQPTDGKWLAELDPVQAGGPFEMEIISCDGSIKLQDIYAGDVWLCSGQSNMEMQMQRLRDDFSEEWAAVENNEYLLIRQFKVPQEWDFSAPRDDLTGGNWLCVSAQTLHEFSGTAWFFAKKLYEKYRIPLGLVNTAWGGTPVEAWMSTDALADFPDKIAAGKQYADSAYCAGITEKANEAVQKWYAGLWQNDLGINNEWQNPQTDLSEWNEIKLPGDFSGAGLDGFCGVIWLAKEFDVSDDFASKIANVWLGTIVDADTVYINGVETGNTGYRYPPRKYVPVDLIKRGTNRIVIRVTCNNGQGEITTDKPFRIFTDNENIELSGTWKYKIGAVSPVRPPDFFLQWQPIGNFNAMIAPVLKFPLNGVIWYQGESNESAPYEYARLFSLMIKDWRQKNKNQNLPYLFVQLPIFGISSDNNEQSRWALLREAQAETLALDATGMAAALELGEWNDIHPINKKGVGERLFLAAEKTLYGEKNTSPGPVVREKRLDTKERKIYIYFDNCGSGLQAQEKDEKVYVSVINSEGQVRLPAEIEGVDVISIDISSVKEPEKVLYAWADNPRDRQLFNSEGLPVIPFRVKIT